MLKNRQIANFQKDISSERKEKNLDMSQIFCRESHKTNGIEYFLGKSIFLNFMLEVRP